MTLDDLFKIKRVSDPQMSPDGQWVVYTITNIDDVAKNKVSSNLWLAATDGKSRRQLTNTDKKDRQPRWSPDSKSVLFVSTRSGTPQLWLIDVNGGEARQLTTISTGAAEPTWSRDGKRIAFVSAVWPEFSAKPFKDSDKLHKDKIEEQKKSAVIARVFTRLPYRYWDEYLEDKRLHLFVCDFADGKAGEPRDVTPGDYNAFPVSESAGADNFTFSPDGTHLLFTAPPKENEAWSNNYDIWRIAVDGKGKPENLTKDNTAADGAPQFSPDGKHLAYRAQKRPGCDADLWQIVLVDVNPSGGFTGKPAVIEYLADNSVNEFAWGTVRTGEKTVESCVVFTTDFQGVTAVVAYAPKQERFHSIGKECIGTTSAMSFSSDGQMSAHLFSQMHQPADVMVTSLTDAKPASALNVSQANAKLLSELDLSRPESVALTGAGSTPTQMWLLKPPGFDATKKWPVAYLIHGGPESAWSDSWNYRWNAQLWAAQGYIVAMPNPRGSVGFGQQFIDDIRGDWGGKSYIDLMRSANYLDGLPFVDKDRVAAA
ncbi:MAG TPA: prolyl oligopeptidase family serine peptidase, partial [Gemmataceae bacterium]|nr:prolyl oligopeptidase family serine peptidase [Gemmataceae bacterium]